MGRHSVAVIGVLMILLGVSSAFAGPQFFHHAGWKGGAGLETESDVWDLGKVTTNIGDIEIGKQLKGRISSYKIPDGWTVTFYKNEGHTGEFFTVTGPAQCGSMQNGWNDTVESLKVRWTGERGSRLVDHCPAPSNRPAPERNRDPDPDPSR